MTKFRTAYDLQDFEDNEVYEPGTSETEEGQEINVKQVYERCLRGELPNLIAGDYDIKGDMDIEEAFATIDPTQSENFDLSDATAYSNYMAEKLSKSEDNAGMERGTANSKASDERVLKAESDASKVLEEKPSN